MKRRATFGVEGPSLPRPRAAGVSSAVRSLSGSRAPPRLRIAVRSVGEAGGERRASYRTPPGRRCPICFGIIALTDCSPIVIAHEKGFFKKYGINATIVKGASWAGDPRLAHERRSSRRRTCCSACRSPRRWASSARPRSPMVIPWLLNRNGQAITMKSDAQGQGGRRSQGAQAVGRRGQEEGHAHDLRHDVPAWNARHVDALLTWARAASTRTRTSRS